MIEYKGLTEEEVQKLIDKEIEWKKEFEEVYLPMWIRMRVFELKVKEIMDNLNSQGINNLGRQPNNSA